MERKNTVLLTVIAVATLLVAVVGATFAYFTASTANGGAGESASVTTTTVGDVELNMSTVTTSNDLDYPGGFLVVGAKVEATADSGSYATTYTVNGTVSNNTRTALNWTLYERSSVVANPVAGCDLKETAAAGETQYYYEGCNVTALTEGATKVDEGTVTAGSETTAGSATIAAAGETLDTGASTYYYLVVEYPNGGNQDADQGKTITASLTSVSNGTATAK